MHLFHPILIPLPELPREDLVGKGEYNLKSMVLKVQSSDPCLRAFQGVCEIKTIFMILLCVCVHAHTYTCVCSAMFNFLYPHGR